MIVTFRVAVGTGWDKIFCPNPSQVGKIQLFWQSISQYYQYKIAVITPSDASAGSYVRPE